MTGNGFFLSHHKSEAIMLTRKWAYTTPVLRVGGGAIVRVRSFLRYLGVTLDIRLTFEQHVAEASGKAVKVLMAVTIEQLMPIVERSIQAK